MKGILERQDELIELKQKEVWELRDCDKSKGSGTSSLSELETGESSDKNYLGEYDLDSLPNLVWKD